MNNYFNVNIPSFNDRHGNDWEPFKQIVEDETDYHFQKIFELYYLNNIDRMPDRIVKAILDIMDVEYSNFDTPASRKNKLRTLASKYTDKGLEVIYADVITPITSIAPDFYNGAVYSAMRWGVMRWGTMRWSSGSLTFHILIETYTTDNDELDEIERLLTEKVMKPAFYKIFLLSNGIVARSF